MNKHCRQTTLNVHGVIITAVTIAGLAEIIGKSTDTIRRYEKTDIFPVAPLMLGRVRYYPLSLARKLAVVVEKFRGNKKPDSVLVTEIINLFNAEREKYATSKKES
jgi:hypothetical protein